MDKSNHVLSPVTSELKDDPGAKGLRPRPAGGGAADLMCQASQAEQSRDQGRLLQQYQENQAEKSCSVPAAFGGQREGSHLKTMLGDTAKDTGKPHYSSCWCFFVSCSDLEFNFINMSISKDDECFH